MSVRLLHAADMHLGRAFHQLDAVAEARQKDLLDTFVRICDTALQEEVAALLIAGDLFDVCDPPSELVGFVQGQIDRLAAQRIFVFIIPGNHDDVWYERSIWRRGSFPGARLFSDATLTQSAPFDVEGVTVHIHGLAYNHTISQDPLSSLQHNGTGIHVALMHATLDAPETLSIERRYFPLSRHALLDAGFDYVALGHIHKQRTFEANNRIFACYPGSPEGLDATEIGPRYVALVEFNGGPPRVGLIEVNKRRVVTEYLDVTGMSTDEIAQTLGLHARKKDVCTVRLIGQPSDVVNIKYLKERLAGAFFWLDVEDRTEMVSSKLVDDWAVEHTIRGAFVRALRERIAGTEDANRRLELELALKLGIVHLQERSL